MTDEPDLGRRVARSLGLDPADADSRWDPWPFADPIPVPTMRERAVIVASRASRAAAVADRTPDLAHGAAWVASVAAIRMAVTPAASEDDHGFKVDFLRGFCDRGDGLRRDRLAPLVGAALEAEVDRRRLDGLSVAGPGCRFTSRRVPIRALPIESSAATDRRDRAARRLDASLDEALHVTGLLLGDLRRLSRTGACTEGSRRSLGDVGFALCLGTAASIDDADPRVALLGILHDTQRDDDPSGRVIATGIDLERVRWGNATVPAASTLVGSRRPS